MDAKGNAEAQSKRQPECTTSQQCLTLQQTLPSTFAPKRTVRQREGEAGDALGRAAESARSPDDQTSSPGAETGRVCDSHHSTVTRQPRAFQPAAGDQSSRASPVFSSTVEPLSCLVNSVHRENGSEHGFTVVSRGHKSSAKDMRTRCSLDKEERAPASVQRESHTGKPIQVGHNSARSAESATRPAGVRLAAAVRKGTTDHQHSDTVPGNRLFGRSSAPARQRKHAADVSSFDNAASSTSGFTWKSEASPPQTARSHGPMSRQRELSCPASDAVAPQARSMPTGRGQKETRAVRKHPEDPGGLLGSAEKEQLSPLPSLQATTQASETGTEPNNSSADARSDPPWSTTAPPKRWIDQVSDDDGDDEGCLSVQEQTGRTALSEGMDLPSPKKAVALDDRTGHPALSGEGSPSLAMRPGAHPSEEHPKAEAQAVQSVEGLSSASSVSSGGAPGRRSRHWASSQVDNTMCHAGASCWPSLGAAAAVVHRKKSAGSQTNHR